MNIHKKKILFKILFTHPFWFSDFIYNFFFFKPQCTLFKRGIYKRMYAGKLKQRRHYIDTHKGKRKKLGTLPVFFCKNKLTCNKD